MRVGTIFGIIIFIAVIVIIGLLFFTGVISADIFNFSDDDPSNPNNANVTADRFTNLGLSNFDIHSVISFLTNTTPPFTDHQIFIEGLHMKCYGIDGATAYSVLLDYEESFQDDDFTSYTMGIKRGTGWTAYSEIWYNDLGMGRAIIVGDGSSVRSAYGYDTVLLTSYGPVTDYYDYISFLARY